LSFVLAQRGMGDATGVARWDSSPALTTVSGEIVAIETHPCENTTGFATSGTHLHLKTSDGDELNVHLGWADAVKPIIDQIEVGDAATITAFRTEAMQEGHYVAQTVTVGEETFRLRDEFLRPTWAGGRLVVARPAVSVGQSWGGSQGYYGMGNGMGRGRQWRGGQGRGRGLSRSHR